MNIPKELYIPSKIVIDKMVNGSTYCDNNPAAKHPDRGGLTDNQYELQIIALTAQLDSKTAQLDYKTEEYNTAAANLAEIILETKFNVTFTAAPTGGTVTLYDTIAAASIAEGAVLTRGDNITITATPSSNYTLSALTVNGDAFVSTQAHIVYEDVIVVPTFLADSYAITYMDTSTPITGLTPATYSFDTGVETLPTYVKASYTFDGWYTDAALTTPITSISPTATGVITLYAKTTLIV